MQPLTPSCRQNTRNPSGCMFLVDHGGGRKWRQALAAVLMVLVVVASASQAFAASDAFDPLFSLCLASTPPTVPETLWGSWSLAPAVLLPLLLVFAFYSRGLLALQTCGKSPLRWQMLCAAAGWLVLVVALISPLCRLAATLVSAHMVQHMLLVAVAPPLLVLAAPLPVLRASLPQDWQMGLSALAAALSGWGSHLGGSLAAGAAYGAAIWLWHVPVLYQAVLLDPLLHTLAYVVLIAISLLFWASIVTPGARDSHGHGASMVSLLATLMHTGLLGALLTFTTTPWYPVLSVNAGLWGVSPLADQQLAGLVMWMPMGMIYLVASLIAAGAWLTAAAHRTSAPT